jgi:hypothetical protein
MNQNTTSACVQVSQDIGNQARRLFTTDAPNIQIEPQRLTQSFKYSRMGSSRDSVGRPLITFQFSNTENPKYHTGITVYLPAKDRSIGSHSHLYKALVRLSGGLACYQTIRNEALEALPQGEIPELLTTQIISRVHHSAINKKFRCVVDTTEDPNGFRLRDFWLLGYLPEPASYKPAPRPFKG